MLLNERVAVVKFGIAAPSIPFHVLGHVAETEVPWRQSAKPWYAHAYVKQLEVENPFSDDFLSRTSIVHCRMISGMVYFSYNRARQSLSISGNNPVIYLCSTSSPE